MSTRLRGWTGVTAPITPAFGLGSSWARSDQAFRCAATDGTPAAGFAATTMLGTTTANDDVLMSQNIWGPLAAQVVGGAGVTVKGQQLIREENAAVDARAQMRLFVCGPDGTLRGVCVEKSTAALSSEFVANYTNRKFPLAAISPVTLTAVVARAGDYLVYEQGYRQHGTNSTGCRSFTSIADADAPEDETTLSATGFSRPWIEISQDIELYVAGGQSMMHDLGMGVG